MRSRLTTRSARLALAAAALTALAAATACNPQDTTSAGSSATPSPAASIDSGQTPSSAPSSVKPSGSSDPGGTSDSDNGDSDGGKSGYGQSCGTNDLNLTLSSQSQAGGYYLVAAKAKPGITCYLDPNTPTVSFGSSPDDLANPVGQGGEDPIKLTGEAVAYTGVSPKTTNSDAGKQFDSLIIATSEDDPNPAELPLPETANVDKPIVTNWATHRAEAVPRIA